MAWISTNMFPISGTGEITGKKDATSAQEVLNLDIEFSAVTVSGPAVAALAQTFLDSIRNNGLNADPQMRTAFLGKVSDALNENSNGFANNMAQVAKDAVASMSK
jgi:hypothetical protein